MELKTDGYRLHKTSPLFLFIEAVKKMIIPLIFGILEPSGDYQEVIFLSIGILASTVTIIQFWFYRYWLEEDRLVVQEGILFKSLRQIPYARIQNLNIERSLLHKYLKVGTLQVESASGSKPEAVIRVVSEQQIKYIQSFIKKKSRESKEVETSEDEVNTDASAKTELPLYEMSNKDVTIYGFISYRGLWILGIGASLLSQSDGFRNKLVDTVKNLFGFFRVDQWALSEWFIYGAITSMVLLIFIWMSSIALSFLKLYQFSLTKEDNNLHAEMGLLTKITANIPIKRIQLLKIKHSPLHRYFKKVSVKMETAGGVTEQSGISMSWIAPLISKFKAQQLITEIQPEVNWREIQWLGIEPRAWKRVFKRVSFFVLLVMAPLLYFFHGWGLLMLVFFPLAYVYAKAYVNKTEYALNDEIIAYRHGVIFHTISIVKVGKIQNISSSQTPFDRRNQMARMTVDTAGSNPSFQNINIHYLNTDTIEHLTEKLSDQVSQTKFVW